MLGAANCLISVYRPIARALNHILIVAKFHIYSCNYDKTHPNLIGFITLLKDKISIEKYIAYASHAEESLKKSGNL